MLSLILLCDNRTLRATCRDDYRRDSVGDRNAGMEEGFR